MKNCFKFPLFNRVWSSSSPHHISWAEWSQSMRNRWRRGRWWVSWLNPRKVQKKVMLRGVSQTRLRTRNWFWLATGASDKCVIGFGDPSRWHTSRREREPFLLCINPGLCYQANLAEKITGRPIVSGNNCPTAKISAFVDKHIKMMVPLIPSYVRDTPDFIRKIENFSITGDVYLVTMDMTSLYTNIPNMEGLVSIARSRMKHQPEFKLKYKTLLELLKLVLHKNNFQFNGEHYLTATSYAKLFMATLEEKLLEKAKTDLQIELPLYLRYIDDIFFIFPYSEMKLEQFMTLMNSYRKTIKFTEEHSRNKIIFLDTYVKCDKDSLYTDLYVKETATHSYLNYPSCHPQTCTRKGPYGNSLRIKRNCAKSADFEKHSKDMKMHYANQGCPDEIIEESYQKAHNQDHHELIQGTKTKAEGTKRIPLFLTYNPLNPNLLKIIKKHWPVLHLSPECKELFPETQILAYRRNRNLWEREREREREI